MSFKNPESIPFLTGPKSFNPNRISVSDILRNRRVHFISIFGLFLTGVVFILRSSNSHTTIASWLQSTPDTWPHHEKYAYCTFLGPYTPSDEERRDEDVYFVGARMHAYQLLHDPQTRTTHSIPFLVLVTSQVEQEKRDQLTKDGATVIEIPQVAVPEWIHPGRARWSNVLDKLNVFKLTDFDKVLLLDLDMAIVKPLDDVFRDPAAAVSTNLGLLSRTVADEPSQPQSYVMAGYSGLFDQYHNMKLLQPENLSAGFVVLRPSLEFFDYYMAVAQLEGRFRGTLPEQDLWNYVHSPLNSNMPWKSLDPKWHGVSAVYRDYENGIAVLHAKFWDCQRDLMLCAFLKKRRQAMFDYWEEVGTK